MNKPVILGNNPTLLHWVRWQFRNAREQGEFDRERAEPSGAEWAVWRGREDGPDGWALLSFAGPGMMAIEPIFVVRPLRRRGFGRALVAEALAAAEGLGASSVLIGMTRDNAATRALAGALGFAETGVIMSRTIGA